jgi:hypothetical protein
MCRCKEQENAPKHAVHLVTGEVELQSAGPPSSTLPALLSSMMMVYCDALAKEALLKIWWCNLLM